MDDKREDHARSPRPKAISGLPIEDEDQIGIAFADPWSSALTVSVVAGIYDPVRDRQDAGPVGGLEAILMSGTSPVFSKKLPRGRVLTSIAVNTSAFASPLGPWVTVGLFRNGAVYEIFFSGELYDRHVPAWPQDQLEHGRADIVRRGAMHSVSLIILNNAMNAGAQTVRATPATGSRFRPRGHIHNRDTVARVGTVEIVDAAAGNRLIPLIEESALGADTLKGYPLAGAGGGTPSTGAVEAPDVAGADVLESTLAAVAVSQDSTHAMVLEEYGGTAAISSAAPCGATITTNRNRLEAG